MKSDQFFEILEKNELRRLNLPVYFTRCMAQGPTLTLHRISYVRCSRKIQIIFSLGPVLGNVH